MQEGRGLFYSKRIAKTKNVKEIYSGFRLFFCKKSSQPRVRVVHPEANALGALIKTDTSLGIVRRVDTRGHIPSRSGGDPINNKQRGSYGFKKDIDAPKEIDPKQQIVIDKTEGVPVCIEIVPEDEAGEKHISEQAVQQI